MIGVCSATGKRQYQSRKAARRARRSFASADGHLAAYLCQRCERWHLGNLPAFAIRTSRDEAGL